MSNTTLTGTVGTNVALTTAGGSGTGDVTFSVTGTGCSVSGTWLIATEASTCIVTATKAASTGYLSATSEPKTFTFTAWVAQAALTVSNTTLTGTVGTDIWLRSSGGSGTGIVKYEVPKGTACSVIVMWLRSTAEMQLRSTAATRCIVTATKAPSTGYPSEKSEPKTFTFCATSLGAWSSVIAPAGGDTRTVTFQAPKNPAGWASFTALVYGGSRNATLATSLTGGSITVTGLIKGANNTFTVTGKDVDGCSYTSQQSSLR